LAVAANLVYRGKTPDKNREKSLLDIEGLHVIFGA